MFDEIDNMQSEIDALNALCRESLGEPGGRRPVDVTQRRQERLGIFLLKLLDGVLERRYLLRLEKWLIADPDAQRYYVDFMSLTAMLHLHYHPDAFKQSASTAMASH